MNKFEKLMGFASTADKRRTPVPDAPNKLHKPGTTRNPRRFVLKIHRESAWRRTEPWIVTRRFASPAARAQARYVEEREAQRYPWRKILKIEEIDE